MSAIYKLLTPAQWAAFQTEAHFIGAPIDLTDGFIHFSAVGQVRETAAKHFTSHDEVVLVEVATQAMGESLVWEVSRGGALFPHLYGILELDAVLRSWHIKRNSAHGEHDFSAVDWAGD